MKIKNPDQKEITKEEARLLTANIYCNSKQFHKAIPIYEELIISAQDKAQKVQLLNALGVCYLEAGKTDKAISTLQELIKYTPEDASVWFVLGEKLFLKDKRDSALNAFAMAVSLEPSNHKYSNTFLGLSVWRDNEIISKNSLEAFKNIIPEHIMDVAWAVYYYFGEQDTSKSVEYAQKCTQQHKRVLSDFVINEMYSLQEQCYFKNGQYADMQRVLEEKIAQTAAPVASDYNSLAVALYRQSKFVESANASKKAIDIEPDTIVYYRNYIDACKQAGISEGILEMGLKKAELSKKNAAAKICAPAVERLSNPNVNFDQTPILLEASIDLKLTNDGRVKIIEMNDLYSSGFDGFRRAYGQDMREDIIFPYHENIEMKLEYESRSCAEIITPSASKDRLEHICETDVNLDTSKIFSSGTLPWWAVNERKDYLHLTTPKKWDHMYPRTLVIPRSSLDAQRVRNRLSRVLGAFDDSSNFIVKPCNDSIGRGVELVSGASIVEEILEISSWNAPENSYWHDHTYPNFLVQECVRSRTVMADNGKLYDGTMRVAFTALISADKKSVQSIEFHQPYWKLPSRPYDHEDSRNSVVSFPPTSLSKISNEAFAAEIPISAQVNEHDSLLVAAQLRPYLRDVLPGYSLSVKNYKRQLETFLNSRFHAHKALGLELATSFINAACFNLVLGEHAEKEIMEKVIAVDTSAKSAPRKMLDFLYDSPVQSASHAADLAGRCEDLLRHRTGKYVKELEVKDWFDDVVCI